MPQVAALMKLTSLRPETDKSLALLGLATMAVVVVAVNVVDAPDATDDGPWAIARGLKSIFGWPPSQAE